MKEKIKKVNYGYNILRYIAIILIGGGIATITLAIIFSMLDSTWLLILCWSLGIILLISGIFSHLSMGWIKDSKKVEHFQDVSLSLLKTIWNGKGKVLDIGTGRGRIAIEVAKQFPEAKVVGVDTWTKRWKLFGMTKEDAERNARIANASNRCFFKKGSALDLPFKDGEFQLVVSSFVFHEISVPDKTAIFKEVIRVLAPGGYFGICDVFNAHYLKYYQVKNLSELLKKIQQMGAKDINYKTLKDAGLNLGGLSHIWGMGYISGRKT